VRMLGLQPLAQFAGFAPLILRVMAGIIMTVHGWQRLQGGPANFGSQALANLGVPLPVFMGYVVTFVELIGGILLIIGLLSRFAALILAIEMVFTTLLVKINVGFIGSQGSGAGAEFDLILLAAFLTILLVGPGRLSVDELVGTEGQGVERRWGRRIWS
jgi:putative oxidoreductase